MVEIRVSRVIIITVTLLVGVLSGQEILNLAVPERFEAVSIRPAGDRSVRGSSGGPLSSDPGRYSFGLVTPLDLIMVAYHVDRFQVSSKTALDQQRFDVVATVPPGATMEQFQAMVRNLLVERFHLTAHVETREFPAYELMVAKSGFKLKEIPEDAPPAPAAPAAPGDERFPALPPNRAGMTSKLSNSGGGVVVRTRAQQQPIAALARSIRLADGMPVIDRTGLSGKYDFTLEYSYEVPNAANASVDPPAVANVFSALPQQLGLQLVAKKLPFDVVVVDSIEKTPTEN